MHGRVVFAFLLVIAAASCAPRREAVQPQSIRVEPTGAKDSALPAPPPAKAPCDPLLAATVQRITRIPYALDRTPFHPKVPVLGLQGEVVEAFVYATHEPILNGRHDRPAAYDVFSLVVTRPTGALPTADETLTADAMKELRKRRPPIELPAGRAASLVHIPGGVFVDIPRADGRSSLRFMWGGIPFDDAREPPELLAWLTTFIDDDYREFDRVARELDACGPP